jgi:epoxide hydrolase-like predicted phosphatase
MKLVQNKKQILVPLKASNSSFRALIFDWGGVFIAPRRIAPSTRQLEESLNIPEGTLSKLLYNNDYWTKAQLGKITDEEFWRLSLRQFDIVDSKGISKFKEKLFSGERVQLRLGMINLVKQLKRHYVLALLTNADDVFRPLLQTKFHVDQLFNHIIISAEVGIAKPDIEIFRQTCKIVNALPPECIFIDDSPANVQSAKSIGMYSIQYLNSRYKNTNSLKKELRMLGISL